MKWESAANNFVNFVIFIAAVFLIGVPLGGYVDGLLSQASGSWVGILIGYGVAFTVYVYVAKWFHGKASFDD